MASKQNEVDVNGRIFQVPAYLETNKTYGLYIASDLHIDAKTCNRALLAEQLRRASEEGRGVLFVGDVFDAICGWADPRRSYGELPETLAGRDDLFNAVVDDAASFLAASAKGVPFMIVGRGNHERSVERKSNISLTTMLVSELRLRGIPAYPAPVMWWLMIAFNWNKTKRRKIRIYAHHGAGGGARVTRSTINANRTAVNVDADIFIGGHTHNDYIFHMPRIRLTERGFERRDKMTFIRTPGFKGYGAFEEDTDKEPPLNGGAFIDFFLRRDVIQWRAWTELE